MFDLISSALFRFPAPEDYTRPGSVVFTNGDRESAVKCSLIIIIDDKIVEERESFLVEIVNDSSTQPAAITFGMPANISIIDNDGEFWASYIIKKTPLCVNMNRNI